MAFLVADSPVSGPVATRRRIRVRLAEAASRLRVSWPSVCRALCWSIVPMVVLADHSFRGPVCLDAPPCALHRAAASALGRTIMDTYIAHTFARLAATTRQKRSK